MAKTVEEAIKSLQNRSLTIALFGKHGRNERVNPEFLLEDGRSRKRQLKELIEQGYIAEVEGELRQTDKAFETLPMIGVDLTKHYQFDRFHPEKCDYITFDRLTQAEKKWVIVQLQAGNADYTLMACEDRGTPKLEPFKIGEGGPALEKVGGWSEGRIVVTSVALKERHKQAIREDYKQQCMSAGLNWYLREIKATEPEEEVPVSEKTPFLGQCAALPYDAAQWGNSLADTIARTKTAIQKERARLVALEKLEKAIDDAGGWSNFLANYEKAIDAYVDDKLKQPS